MEVLILIATFIIGIVTILTLGLGLMWIFGPVFGIIIGIIAFVLLFAFSSEDIF